RQREGVYNNFYCKVVLYASISEGMPKHVEVQAVRTGEPASIDKFGFYVVNDTTTEAPANLTTSEEGMLKREEEFWTSRICCYLRLSLELHKCEEELNNNNNSNSNSNSSDNSNDSRFIEVMTLRQAQQRVGKQMRRHIRLYNGVLHATLRRLVWGFFTGSLQRPASVIQSHHARYISLADMPVDRSVSDVIRCDLSRTFPTHCLFVGDGSVGQVELRRILSAFSQLDPAVGYCQGMAFIAATLLLHAPEEEAFWMLIHLSFSPLFRMRELFLPGFPLLQVFFAILHRLIERLLPSLHRHFLETGVEAVLFASQWFLTLYTYQFPIDFTSRLWDLFFAEGWRIMFMAAIAILQGEKEQLMLLDMEETLLWLKDCHDGKSTEEMLRRVRNVPLTEEEFTSLWRAEEEGREER
ncbi:rab6 GTPase activating protein, partial [Trypanosoma theileri]